MDLLKWKEKLERKILAVFTALIITCLPILGQDRLVKAGPVDRRMHSIDSVIINRKSIFEELSNPAYNIYSNWSNTLTHYKGEILTEYKVDLRSFSMPCYSKKITSHYGYRPKFGRNHYGVDIKVYIGDTIYATFNGKVRIVKYDANGYGNYIVIRHNNGLETYYGHLSKQLVKPNQLVKSGEPIGLGGNTGKSTGSHLHFETRLFGKCINPESLFNFEMADINGDYFLFKSNGNSEIIGNKTINKKFEIKQNKIHVITKENETLASVSKKLHVSIKHLCNINGFKTNVKLHKQQIIKY